MAHEVDLRKNVPPLPVAPDGGDLEPAWYAGPQLTERPEWTELRPPYHPDSVLERRWSAALTPLRAVALGFLWLTYQWYRFAIAVGTLLLLYVAYSSR